MYTYNGTEYETIEEMLMELGIEFYECHSTGYPMEHRDYYEESGRKKANVVIDKSTMEIVHFESF